MAPGRHLRGRRTCLTSPTPAGCFFRGPGTVPCRGIDHRGVSRVLFFLRRRPQLTSQDPYDGNPARVPAFGPVRFQFGDHGGEALVGQTERGRRCPGALAMVDGSAIQCDADEFTGPLRVPADARRFSFSDLHGGGSEMAGA